MAYFEFSSIVPAKREEVFKFHANLDNLLQLLPSSYSAEPTTPSAPFSKGSEFEVKLTRYGVSLIWAGIIEEFDPSESYVDRQAQGPFSLWIHTHKFEDHAAGTVVTDLIEYEVPFGLMGKLLDDLYVRNELRKFFEVRHEKTKRHFEAIQEPIS